MISNLVFAAVVLTTPLRSSEPGSSPICCGVTCCSIDGACFTTGDTNPANECQICDPAASATAWTNSADPGCAGGSTDGSTTGSSGGGETSTTGETTDPGSGSTSSSGSETDEGETDGHDTDHGSDSDGDGNSNSGGGSGCSAAGTRATWGLGLFGLVLVRRRRRD